MNRFFPGRDEDGEDPAALDPMAHPVTPQRMAGAARVMVAIEEAASRGKEAASPEPELVEGGALTRVEPAEPVPERVYRAKAAEALKARRTRLSPGQRAARRAVETAGVEAGRTGEEPRKD